MTRELAARAEQLGRSLREGFHERETLALQNGGRQRLATEPLQFRFGLEELELARRPGHEQVDHALRTRRVVGPPGPVRLCGEERVSHQQRSQRELADTDPAVLEQLTSRSLRELGLTCVHETLLLSTGELRTRRG